MLISGALKLLSCWNENLNYVCSYFRAYILTLHRHRPCAPITPPPPLLSSSSGIQSEFCQSRGMPPAAIHRATTGAAARTRRERPSRGGWYARRATAPTYTIQSVVAAAGSLKRRRPTEKAAGGRVAESCTQWGTWLVSAAGPVTVGVRGGDEAIWIIVTDVRLGRCSITAKLVTNSQGLRVFFLRKKNGKLYILGICYLITTKKYLNAYSVLYLSVISAHYVSFVHMYRNLPRN